MKKTYNAEGTCTQRIDLEIENGIIKSAQFFGGCPGNLTAVARLVTGMDALKAKELLKGIPCGMRSTSCPDQLSKAIETALET